MGNREWEKEKAYFEGFIGETPEIVTGETEIPESYDVPEYGECPNCGVIWGWDEMEFEYCSACGYPDGYPEFLDEG